MIIFTSTSEKSSNLARIRTPRGHNIYSQIIVQTLN